MSRVAAIAVAVFFIGAIATFQITSRSTTTETVEVAAQAGSGGEAGADHSAAPSTTTTEPLTEAPPVLRLAPEELLNIDGWLQTDGTTLAEVRGDVTILQFWTYSCHNCTATIPHLQDIYAKHNPNGLEIIGVHAPEFEFEKDPVGIQDAADRLGVTWPIALDTSKKNFRSWQEARRFWPRTYVIDQNGDIRFDKIGEGKYEELEATVAYLLENPADQL